MSYETIFWIIIVSILWNIWFWYLRRYNAMLFQHLKIECDYSTKVEYGKEKLLSDITKDEKTRKCFKKYFLKK